MQNSRHCKTIASSDFQNQMRISRLSRVVFAIIVIFELLFAQLAVASFVCPELNAPVKATFPRDDAKIDHCATLNAERSSLCHAHCEPDSQRSHMTYFPPIKPFVATELTVLISDASIVASAHGSDRQYVLLQRSTAPSLAIRNCCFRI
jgi:hypothetical protein